MANGKRRALRAFGGLDLKKKNKVEHIPGILGVPIGGVKTVEVPTRESYVYVRLRHNLSELVQVFNDEVAPVYGLPVLIKKDDLDPSRYVIAGRDLGVYATGWGGSPYLPKHGNTHRFWAGGGGDVVFVEDRQLMPLLVHPSGTFGACNVVIEPDVYYQDGRWKYAGNTGSPDICSLKPTDGTAKMVLLYLDGNSNPQLVAGSTFGASITGIAQVMPFVPNPPAANSVPLAWIRLVSGTERIGWTNIYDARPWIVGDGVLSTGSSGGGHIIQDEGIAETARPALNFTGDIVFVTDDVGNNRTNVIFSGSASSGGSSGGWTSGAKAKNTLTQSIPNDFIHPIHFNTEVYDTDGYFTIATGTSTRLTVLTSGTYSIVGNLSFAYSTSGTERGIEIVKNGVTTTGNQVYLSVVGSVNLNISAIEKLVPNDYVELHAYQDTGAALNATASATNLAIQRIG